MHTWGRAGPVRATPTSPGGPDRPGRFPCERRLRRGAQRLVRSTRAFVALGLAAESVAPEVPFNVPVRPSSGSPPMRASQQINLSLAAVDPKSRHCVPLSSAQRPSSRRSASWSTRPRQVHPVVVVRDRPPVGNQVTTHLRAGRPLATNSRQHRHLGALLVRARELPTFLTARRRTGVLPHQPHPVCGPLHPPAPAPRAARAVASG